MKKEKMIKILEDVKSFLEGESEREDCIQNGDKYWTIGIEGDVNWCIYNDDEFDEGVMEIDNLYKTEEEAEKQVEKLKAIVRVKNYIKDNFGYDPEKWADWEDENEEKYYMFFAFDINEISSDYETTIKINSFIGYLKSEEDCEILIDNCKKDLKLILK